MTSAADWRLQLKATERYDNIEKLRKCFENKDSSTSGSSRKIAFAAETEAYNTSKSREEYNAACERLLQGVTEDSAVEQPSSSSPGISIGHFEDCHHIASGLVSEVYKSKKFALKVITETRDVEPHNAAREIKILNQLSHPSIIKLVAAFSDAQSRPVLQFPFLPYTLAKCIESGSVSSNLIHSCFQELFSALAYLHKIEIIHRDIKPSNILLASPTGPAYLADFGTAWHPQFSASDELADHKVLEVGTTCYRAPETLFGNRSYNTSLDMWSTGAMLAECLRIPSKPLFESRGTHEDGNQLGLILSIFKTIGTPTKETWPEAINFSTPPFEWYQEFPGKSWEELLPSVRDNGRNLVNSLVCYESGKRLTAEQALEHPFFAQAQ